MKAPISAAVAIAAGILVLLGYFIPLEVFQSLRAILVQWAVILAAFALLVGIANLLYVHWSKVKRRKPGGFYSLVLLAAFLVTVVVAIVSGPTGSWSIWMFNYIQFPVEASLLALLAVILLLAVVRLFRRRLDTFSVVFVLSALLVLLGAAPLFIVGDVPGINLVHTVIVQILSVAGARGILLGVALGIIATAMRILLGADRPYGG